MSSLPSSRPPFTPSRRTGDSTPTATTGAWPTRYRGGLVPPGNAWTHRCAGRKSLRRLGEAPASASADEGDLSTAHERRDLDVWSSVTACRVRPVARRADDLRDDPAIEIVNADEDTSPAGMAAWLAELDAEGDWIDLPVTAAELLAEERADRRP